MLIAELQPMLQKLIPDKKITLEMIGKALGVGKSTISTRAKNRSIVSYYELLKIEDYFNVELESSSNIEELFKTKLIDKTFEIEADYYPDVFGSCGNGVFTLSETKERITIPEKCFIKPISKVKTYSVINAYGDSMMPTINDKDRLIVQHFEYGEQILDKSIYVFCYDEQIFIKRLYHNVDEYIIKSDNPEFKTKYVQKEEMNKLHIIGQIVGLMRDLR